MQFDHKKKTTQATIKVSAVIDGSAMSRSSAKQLLARINRFDEVAIDFSGTNSIGPPFADEIFRVFAVAHPRVQLIAVNANEQVTSMIRRAQAVDR